MNMRSAKAAERGAKRERQSADLAARSEGACPFRVLREFLKGVARLAAVLITLSLGAAAADTSTQQIERELKRFIDVFAAVEAQSADPFTSEQAFYAGAIPSALRKLDPFSVFLDPAQTEQLKEMEKSERKGFGSVVSVLPGRVIILQTLPGTPSAKAGLSAGDEIMVINDIPLNRLSFEQLVQVLTEARQREAHLSVRRPGNMRLLQFTLSPDLIDSPSVDRAFLLKPGIGYVRVASFEPKTGALLKSSIESLGGQDLKGLAIDLRNDPGGVVQAALEAAALFLKPGQKILSIRGRATEEDTVKVPEKAVPYAFPVTILINAKTASAAEIVTGALQDHDRATVLGEPSYGKGLVQSVYNLSSNTALALTTAFYYTPSGRSIQKPIEGGQLNPVKFAGKGEHRTDAGRVVKGGGGIQPDEAVLAEPVSRLRMVLEGSGSITAFATDYVQKHKIAGDFVLTPSTLDEFQVYLSERQIQPSIGDWLKERAWIENRLKQEIVNLALGVAKGDEVEAQRDPVIQRALAILGER
jgi:carboxyl-terminal processing protease